MTERFDVNKVYLQDTQKYIDFFKKTRGKHVLSGEDRIIPIEVKSEAPTTSTGLTSQRIISPVLAAEDQARAEIDREKKKVVRSRKPIRVVKRSKAKGRKGVPKKKRTDRVVKKRKGRNTPITRDIFNR